MIVALDADITPPAVVSLVPSLHPTRVTEFVFIVFCYFLNLVSIFGENGRVGEGDQKIRPAL